MSTPIPSRFRTRSRPSAAAHLTLPDPRTTATRGPALEGYSTCAKAPTIRMFPPLTSARNELMRAAAVIPSTLPAIATTVIGPRFSVVISMDLVLLATAVWIGVRRLLDQCQAVARLRIRPVGDFVHKFPDQGPPEAADAPAPPVRIEVRSGCVLRI